MKPGWKTTEFWLTLLTALPSIAVTIGLVPQSDQGLLDAAAAKIAAGLLATVVVAKYIHGRSLVKAARFVVAFIFVLSPSPARAADAWLPWRYQVEQRLRALEQPQPPSPNAALLGQLLAGQQQILGLLGQRQQPPPQYIVLGPQQQIPLGSLPRMDIPMGTPPKQDIPLGGPPAQPIPLGPPPQQPLPLGPQPQQQLAPAPGPPHPLNQLPVLPLSYQRYTKWVPALAR